jgi:hypothetical protein
MLSIQNRMKRLWTIPATFKTDGAAAFEHVNIEPGSSALVNEDHWGQVSKGNLVIEALLTERSLVVTKTKKADLDADELANPASPVAPEDLTAKDERATIESKVELKEIVLDEPTAGKTDKKAK